ncbi:hypothetical protein CFP56_028364 [Quercus suber]|uniref:Uncharacterized protein n=1 Tax=Quercus suber TaxID=58331 RepID=A0AAW0JU84_QUESU
MKINFEFCQFTCMPVNDYKKSDDCNSCPQPDKQSTLATLPQAAAGTGNSGKIKLLANETISNS